jgi:hypothetical protein
MDLIIYDNQRRGDVSKACIWKIPVIDDYGKQKHNENSHPATSGFHHFAFSTLIFAFSN